MIQLMMLLKMEASHALQVIKLKMANLAWIRDFVEKHQVDADLDTGVDGLSYYATEEDFKKAVGWWQHGEQDRLQATFLAGLIMHSLIREMIIISPLRFSIVAVIADSAL